MNWFRDNLRVCKELSLNCSGRLVNRLLVKFRFFSDCDMFPRTINLSNEFEEAFM